jgi:hypothetical protein
MVLESLENPNIKNFVFESGEKQVNTFDPKAEIRPEEWEVLLADLEVWRRIGNWEKFFELAAKAQIISLEPHAIRPLKYAEGEAIEDVIYDKLDENESDAAIGLLANIRIALPDYPVDLGLLNQLHQFATDNRTSYLNQAKWPNYLQTASNSHIIWPDGVWLDEPNEQDWKNIRERANTSPFNYSTGFRMATQVRIAFPEQEKTFLLTPQKRALLHKEIQRLRQSTDEEDSIMSFWRLVTAFKILDAESIMVNDQGLIITMPTKKYQGTESKELPEQRNF